MARFIEVTDNDDGAKRLVNTNWIEEICEGSSRGVWILYIAFNSQGRFMQDYISCQESYEEVKAMILGKDEGK